MSIVDELRARERQNRLHASYPNRSTATPKRTPVQKAVRMDPPLEGADLTDDEICEAVLKICRAVKADVDASPENNPELAPALRMLRDPKIDFA